MVSFFSGGISNSGTIASTGTRVGIYVVQSSMFSGSFANSGVITSANKQSVLINGNTHFTGGVSNGGTIAGHLTGLFVIDNVSFSGGVSNSGLKAVRTPAHPLLIFVGGFQLFAALLMLSDVSQLVALRSMRSKGIALGFFSLFIGGTLSLKEVMHGANRYRVTFRAETYDDRSGNP